MTATDTARACCRRIPFKRQPLWTVAAVSSHQDVLEASHCASLTASLRQLAGVVQHATTAFEKLHGQVSSVQSMPVQHSGCLW